MIAWEGHGYLANAPNKKQKTKNKKNNAPNKFFYSAAHGLFLSFELYPAILSKSAMFSELAEREGC